MSHFSGGDNAPQVDELDLLVIGAGPHALSLLTRLTDDSPDLLTESERTLTMSKAKNAKSKAVVRDHLKKNFDAPTRLPRTMVVDSHGEWLAQWEKDFMALGIEYLRSHQHMHPCPFDFQSLQVYAEWKGRTKELKPMKQVDRDACRKAGYYGPFVVPSSKLFSDFCHSLVERYGLGPLVSKGSVEDIRVIEGAYPRMFEVRLGDGRRFHARRVVCSVGPGPAFRAELPRWADELAATAPDSGSELRVKHSSMLSDWLLKAENERRLAGAKVLIIGGGQTAAHLSLRVLQYAGSSVTLCTRRRIQKKMFDVDLRFIGDKRPNVLKQFWKLQEPKQRFCFNAALRGGGSMSSDVYSKLVDFDPDRLELLEEVEVQQAQWLPVEEKVSDEAGSSSGGDIHVRLDNGRLGRFDYVWLATGGDFDLDLVPMLASMQVQHPIETCHGLPVLREDLSWAKDVPLYIMGAYAQLQLGADALNLAGARSGSTRVARALLDARAATVEQ